MSFRFDMHRRGRTYITRGRPRITSAVLATTGRRGAPAPPLNPRVRQSIHKMIIANKEPNYFDVAPATQEATQTASYKLLTTIPQGDGTGERLRDELSYLSYKIKILATPETGASANTVHHVRVIGFKWHPDTANETPGANDILEDDTDPTSMMVGDQQKRKKFTVLFDMDRFMNSRDANNGSSLIWNEFSGKLNGNLKFNEGLTTGSNHVYIGIFGGYAAGTENWNCIYASRIRYHD